MGGIPDVAVLEVQDVDRVSRALVICAANAPWVQLTMPAEVALRVSRRLDAPGAAVVPAPAPMPVPLDWVDRIEPALWRVVWGMGGVFAALLVVELALLWVLA